MSISFPPDDRIAEELFQFPTLFLSAALNSMVTHYLCGEGWPDFSEEQYDFRKDSYYQSYYPYTRDADFLTKLSWYFIKVDHPEFPKQQTLIETARFFERRGKALLLDKLQNDDARAFGYALPRTPADRPQFIPHDIWHTAGDSPLIDWKNSSLNANGLHFVGVQVVFLSNYELAALFEEKNKPSAALLPDPVQKNKAGRPLFQGYLADAIDSLKDQITTDQRTLYYDIIKKRFFELNPTIPKNTKGLSDENLRIALVAAAERWKKA